MSAQQAAHRAVKKAIKEGKLKRAARHKCVDCGKQAECYDHRDYDKPLDVVPVCFSCNVLRGPVGPIKPRQPRRNFLISGALTQEEGRAVMQAFGVSGFESRSEWVRAILLQAVRRYESSARAIEAQSEAAA